MIYGENLRRYWLGLCWIEVSNGYRGWSNGFGAVDIPQRFVVRNKETEEEEEGLSTEVIVWIVIGSIAGLALIIGLIILIWCCCCREKEQSFRRVKNNTDEKEAGGNRKDDIQLLSDQDE